MLVRVSEINPYSAGIDFRRQNLAKVYTRAESVKLFILIVETFMMISN